MRLRHAWILALLLAACGGDDDEIAYVSLANDFNNPGRTFRPPWTLCESSYRGVDFGKISLDATSAELEVPAGLDYVLMVAAWNSPTCEDASLVPLASKVEEEVVPGQHRTIYLNLANHQGPCPPEGVPPIPEAQYERIRALWPEYDFPPYADRATLPQCAD